MRITDADRICPVCKNGEHIIGVERYDFNKNLKKLYYMDMCCAKCGSHWTTDFYVKQEPVGWFGKLLQKLFGKKVEDGKSNSGN